MSNSKRILITGASSGFGKLTTLALRGRGHTVIAAMRDIEGRNKPEAQELKNAGAHVVELDVTDETSVNRGVDAALSAAGGLDVLINNAGTGTWGIDEGFEVSQAQRIFDVNVLGVMRVNRAVVPHLRAKGQGLIIYISSGLGRIVLPFMAIYTSSKFALEAYAESVQLELAPLGVQSMIVQPGAFGTSFLTNALLPNQDMKSQYGSTGDTFVGFSAHFEEMAKSGQLGNPDEVADAIVEEVERPAGKRPFRRTVGADVMHPVSTINQTCEEVQDGLLTAFGIAH